MLRITRMHFNHCRGGTDCDRRWCCICMLVNLRHTQLNGVNYFGCCWCCCNYQSMIEMLANVIIVACVCVCVNRCSMAESASCGFLAHSSWSCVCVCEFHDFSLLLLLAFSCDLSVYILSINFNDIILCYYSILFLFFSFIMCSHCVPSIVISLRRLFIYLHFVIICEKKKQQLFPACMASSFVRCCCCLLFYFLHSFYQFISTK